MTPCLPIRACDMTVLVLHNTQVSTAALGAKCSVGKREGRFIGVRHNGLKTFSPRGRNLLLFIYKRTHQATLHHVRPPTDRLLSDLGYKLGLGQSLGEGIHFKVKMPPQPGTRSY